MVKADLITGFLGAGKTTFIRKYVTYLLSQGEVVQRVGVYTLYGSEADDVASISRKHFVAAGPTTVVFVNAAG